LFNAVLQNEKLTGLKTLPYSDRLRLTGLEQIEARRILADSTFTNKLLFCHICLDVHDFFQVSDNSTETRDHTYKLFLPHYCTDAHKYFSGNRGIKIRNSIPANTDFTSISSIQCSLTVFNFADNN